MLNRLSIRMFEYDVSPLEAIKRSWLIFLWYGLFMIALGALALFYPAQTSGIFVGVVGIVLLLMGILMLAGTLTFRYSGHFLPSLVLSLLIVAAGLFLMLNPGAGLVTLTIVAAAIFFLDGLLQLVLAFDLRPHRGWLWVVMSGLASCLVAILIAAGFPASSYLVLGILIGIGILTSGIAATILAIRMRNLTREETL